MFDAGQCAPETSEYHGKDDLRDYMGRTYLTFAQDSNKAVPEKCFAPKKLLHTWCAYCTAPLVS